MNNDSKPNIVCKWCRIGLAHQVCKFEPAEPSVTSGITQPVEMDERGDVVRAEPTAEGPKRREPCEDCVWHSCTGLQGGCGCKCHKPPAPQPVAGEGPDKNELDANAKKSMMAQQDRADRDLAKKLGVDVDEMRKVGLKGTPKLEEIARLQTEAILKAAQGPNTGSYETDAEAWPSCGLDATQLQAILAAILRPFITPACTGPDFKTLDKAISDLGELAEMLREPQHEPTGFDLSIALRLDQITQTLKSIEPASTGEANGWISVAVSDEPHGMPEEGKIVLFVRVGGSIEMGWWRGNSSDRDERWQSVETAPQDELIYYSDEQVTHWQPLPFAPTNVPQAEPPK